MCVCVCGWVCVCVHAFTNPFARTECDTKRIFKQSLTGFILQFFFSKTGCNKKNERTESDI